MAPALFKTGEPEMENATTENRKAGIAVLHVGHTGLPGMHPGGSRSPGLGERGAGPLRASGIEDSPSLSNARGDSGKAATNWRMKMYPLVERLRKEDSYLAAEAADEIERLLEALEWIARPATTPASARAAALATIAKAKGK